jgi:AcrR family transcriptional regulator
VSSRPVSAAATKGDDEVRRRRRRGEPRRLLVEAARDLFNRKGYTSTSTREIADLATVSETLIFRNFKSKAGLFREAMVQPFVEAIDAEIHRRRAEPPTVELSRDDTRAFVASMYDVFREHRALAAMVFAADALVESEIAETDMISDVRAAIDRFVTYASDEARAAGKAIDPAAHDLAIRGHMAMVAGVATFGSWYLGKRPPSRQAVIDELSYWVWLRYNPSS